MAFKGIALNGLSLILKAESRFVQSMVFRGGSRGNQSDHATKVKIGQKIVKLK
jgi:hypothetical protein